MSVPIIAIPRQKLVNMGLKYIHSIHYQSSPEDLIQDTLRIGEGVLTSTGALAIRTGEFTGRCPKDKFTVKDPTTENVIDWNEFNIPIEDKYFHIVHDKMMDYLNRRREIWVRDCYACADPRYRLNIRVITEKPWTNLFAYNMFLRPEEEELENFKPDWTVISAPDLKLNPKKINDDLENNWAVVAEAIQTILRQKGYPNPYEALKALTRKNEKITQESISNFIEGLEIKPELKERLKAITPFNYTGI